MIILWGRARVFNNLYQECKANFSQSKTGTKRLKRKKGLGIDMSKCGRYALDFLDF